MDHDAAKSILNDSTKMKNLSEEAFKAVDKDNSGKLDKQETRAAIDDVCVNLFKCDKWDNEKFAEHWGRLDTTDDNEIDDKEFGKLLKWILEAI